MFPSEVCQYRSDILFPIISVPGAGGHKRLSWRLVKQKILFGEQEGSGKHVVLSAGNPPEHNNSLTQDTIAILKE